MKKPFALLSFLFAALWIANPALAECPSFLDVDFKKLRSDKTINLCQSFADKPLLIINTASHCGFTPQLEGLEALHQEYKDKGLVVLGFPSDDFGQEADSEEETAKICRINYGVTFTLFAPIHVKGDSTHPLFKELTSQSESPSWNFNKYVVDSSGKVVKHFSNFTAPDAEELRKAIESTL